MEAWPWAFRWHVKNYLSCAKFSHFSTRWFSTRYSKFFRRMVNFRVLIADDSTIFKLRNPLFSNLLETSLVRNQPPPPSQNKTIHPETNPRRFRQFSDSIVVTISSCPFSRGSCAGCFHPRTAEWSNDDTVAAPKGHRHTAFGSQYCRGSRASRTGVGGTNWSTNSDWEGLRYGEQRRCLN